MAGQSVGTMSQWSSKINGMLNYDFCPWANSYVYWLKKPVGWMVVAALGSLLLGIFVAPQAFAVAAVVAALIAIGMAWPWLAVRGVQANLSWARNRCNEGDSIEVILEITNRWPWPLWGLMIEADSEAVNDQGKRDGVLSLASVPPLSTSRFSWYSKPSCRGVYPQNDCFVATGFPLGIWTARRPLKINGELIVWPMSVPVADLPQLSGENACVNGSLRDRAGHEGDIIGVRPYREGDSLRSVHWAQTARRDTLIVCERQSKARQSVIVQLHCSETKPTDREQLDKEEWLLRLAATVCRQLLSHHWSVVLQIGPMQLSAQPGGTGVGMIMDELARFQWEKTFAQYESGQRISIQRRSSQGSLTVGIATANQIGELVRMDSASASRQRWIVLRDSSSEQRSRGSSGQEDRLSWMLGDQLWMELDLNQEHHEMASQVKRQWERMCHATNAIAG